MILIIRFQGFFLIKALVVLIWVTITLSILNVTCIAMNISGLPVINFFMKCKTLLKPMQTVQPGEGFLISGGFRISFSSKPIQTAQLCPPHTSYLLQLVVLNLFEFGSSLANLF